MADVVDRQSEFRPLATTNLDTGLLKVIAISIMLFDHIAVVFFPDQLWMRAVTRYGYPLFCYCMVIGMLYIHDFKRYFLRVLILALVSQPLTLILRPEWSPGDPIIWNEVFNLAISLIGVYGVKSKRWWVLPYCVLAIVMLDLPYSVLGILWMLVFYLCRHRRIAGIISYSAVVALFSITAAPGQVASIGPVGLNIYVFALLAIPFIFIRTNSGIKLPKWFFYAFYPGHMAILLAIQFLQQF